MQYLGNISGNAPKDAYELAKVGEICETMADMLSECFKNMGNAEFTTSKKDKDGVETCRYGLFLNYLDNNLKANGGGKGWMVGSGKSAADAYAGCMLMATKTN